MTEQIHPIHTNITILGAGIVGLTAAIALAKQGHHVSVLADNDLTIHSAEQQSLNVRSIALSLSSKQILQHYNCWNELSSLCQPINDIQVSSKGHWGVTRLNHKEIACDALGYVIESHCLESLLIDKTQSFNNISLYKTSQYQRIVNHADNVHIEFKHNNKQQKIISNVCLICDGAQSKARDEVGFETQSHDYQQVAIAAHVSGPQMQNTIAYERFTQQGPVAMLPLTNTRYGLVWSCRVKRAKELMACSDQEFLNELQHVFGYRLGKVTSIGKRFSFPLVKKTCHELINKRCVVLGNAAHNLHPVAGQSLNLALRDIAHLSDHLSSLNNIDESLSHYQSLRLKDHQQVIDLGDSLINIFSNNLPILNHMRSAALGLLDITPHLKQDFAWRGMGFAQTAASAQRG